MPRASYYYLNSCFRNNIFLSLLSCCDICSASAFSSQFINFASRAALYLSHLTHAQFNHAYVIYAYLARTYNGVAEILCILIVSPPNPINFSSQFDAVASVCKNAFSSLFMNFVSRIALYTHIYILTVNIKKIYIPWVMYCYFNISFLKIIFTLSLLS